MRNLLFWRRWKCRNWSTQFELLDRQTTIVSEERTTSILSFYRWKQYHQSWSWKDHLPPKHWYLLPSPRGVITKDTSTDKTFEGSLKYSRKHVATSVTVKEATEWNIQDCGEELLQYEKKFRITHSLKGKLSWWYGKTETDRRSFPSRETRNEFGWENEWACLPTNFLTSD